MGKDFNVLVAEEPLFNEQQSMAFLPKVRAVALLDMPAKKPLTPVETPQGFTGSEYMYWGEGNDYANEVERKAHLNTLIPSVLSFKSNHMAAAGMGYGEFGGFDPKTRRAIIEPFVHDEIEAFWEMNNKNLFLEDGFRNLYWWHHAYIDFYLNPSRKFIVSAAVQDSMHCRYAPQNKKTGAKESVIIDANFPRENKDTQQKVSCLDPYFNRVGQIEDSKETRFIYPLFFNSPGRTYYQRTPWHSIIDSKWLDLAEQIPIFKSKLMQNQMHIKYVIYIPEDYWATEFPDWGKMTKAEKIDAKKGKVKEFNDVLTGVEQAGKALALTFKTDGYNTHFPKWEIKEMKGNLGQGEYLEDSQEASDHILFALAFDGTLIGKTPGKQVGAGSGSDKRLADEIFFKNNKPFAIKMFESIEFFYAYNKWRGPKGRRIICFQEEQILTTLNNVTPENRP